MPAWRTAILIALGCAVTFALAASARHWLVEPAAMAERCGADCADAWCLVRAWTIEMFVEQRIGWCALGLSLIATARAWRAVAAIALFAACAGLVLYSTQLCAPAALLALLVFVRERKPAAAASASSSAQKASA